MNKQYLRSLQERAQRLLEISSDESSQQQAFHLSKTKSRRVDLNEVLSGTDLNQMKNQLEDYRNTDVELLKKCINMTNENSELKRQIKSYQAEISQLKAQNAFLQKEVQNSRFQLQKSLGKHPDSPYTKLATDPANQSILPSSINPINSEYHRHKSSSSHNMSSFKSPLIQSQSRQVYNDQIRRIQQRHRKEIGELEQRLRVASQKREQLERMVGKEREKCKKMFKFINEEVPELRDIVTRLTNKVETQVEALLLRDINQNYEHSTNFHQHKPY